MLPGGDGTADAKVGFRRLSLCWNVAEVYPFTFIRFQVAT